MNKKLVYLSVALLFLGSFSLLPGQMRVVGSISGTVLDSTGASVPNAKVVAKDEGTGLQYETTTNAAGLFLFPNLNFGSYEVTVTMEGFQTAVFKNVSVQSSRTTDLPVRLQLGAVTETIEVEGVAPALEMTQNTIANTITNESVTNLPLSGRSTLALARLSAGVMTPTGRETHFQGMPGATINISTDGINNNSTGFKSGGTSFFATVPPRLGAVEEITISTAGLGAEATGEGAMTIKFITRRGSNQYHAEAYTQVLNEFFNANSFYNNARGIPRSVTRRREYGFNVAGPLPLPLLNTKDKLFFFFNLEFYRPRGISNASTTILNPEAQQGIFKWYDSGGNIRSLDVMQMAAEKGLPTARDPIVSYLLSKQNEALQYGTIIEGTALNTKSLSWREPTGENQYYPTSRIDYQVRPDLQISGTWNLYNRKIFGERDWPLPESPQQGAFKNTWYVASLSASWTATPRTLNQFGYGVQHNVDLYSAGSVPEQFELNGNGRRMRLSLPFISPLVSNESPTSRANMLTTLYDNLTLTRGSHQITLGGNYRHAYWFDSYFNGMPTAPSFSVGVASGDPVASVFNNNTIPGLPSTENSNVQNIYALLTGRVRSVSSGRMLDRETRQYSDSAPFVALTKSDVGGLFFQDSWRMRPNLTINFGLRWQFQGAQYNADGVTLFPDYANLLGPSTGLFQPGVLNGVADPVINAMKTPYKGDFINPAPNFGFAWSPNVSEGLLGKLLGGSKTVLRGSYSVNYYDEGLQFFNNASGNTGTRQNLSLDTTMAGFGFGQFTLNSDPKLLPPFATSPLANYAPPFAMSGLNIGTSFSTMKPTLRAPYVQTWNFGIQREIAKNTVVEVRYVGNKSTHVWRTYNLNEINIFENGFLDEFKNAQKNLAINKAAGVNSFANRGLEGQVPLPIFEAAFGRLGSVGPVSNSQGFGNSNFITALGYDYGTAPSIASTLATNATYMCRLFGNKIPNCATARYGGFDAPGNYPINMFLPNPFATGSLNYVDDGSYTSYHGLQLQFRRTYTAGLALNANYTFSKSMADMWANSQNNSESYQTLRNKSLNKIISPFDLRHVFNSTLTYDLPFGRGRKFQTENRAIDAILGGWTVSSILTLQSGTPFKFSSGRATVNNTSDSGIILKGITVKDLQNSLKITQAPIGDGRSFWFIDPKFVGANTQANKDYFANPTTPGVYSSGPIILYGKNSFGLDMSLAREIRLMERLTLSLWGTALNVLNHPSFLPTSLGGINSNNFGLTSGPSGSRSMQFRAFLKF